MLPKLIAPCGMNCGICRAYLRKNNSCHGCHDAEQNKPKTRAACRLRLCNNRKGKFCYDCALFPCDRLEHLDNRYRNKYGMSMIENLEVIKKSGMQKFIRTEKKRWIKGNKVLCVHDKEYYELK